jgi:hypothetical protein
MADNQVTLVEKNISFKIAQQFPAYYREQGPELVAMVEHYYKFVESQPNMGVYNTRRMFEYRDIGTTLSEMIVFFKKKYMADLPAITDDQTIRFVIRNIMDLYRRKGTEAGIQLFFRMFFEEDAHVKYPAKYMFKPSDSNWKTGTYLQMYQNNGIFKNREETKTYGYIDLLSKNIIGSISKAKAIVDKINFVYLSGTLTPIIYITNPRGKFIKYDDILARIDGEDIAFGKLNGSADSLIIDLEYGGTTGNKIGDILGIESEYGKGGKAIVTGLQDEFTGTVNYTLENGGFGYTIDNTKILVSNQVIILDNSNFIFEELEVLTDTAGNQGTVIGQNSSAVGIKMEPGDEFNINRDISTNRASGNFTLTKYDQNTQTGEIFGVSVLNGSSPGPLYANTGDPTHAKVEALTNIETVTLITDIVAPFVSVPLNSSNFNTVPPATQPMSGSADPVTLATPLNQAFDLTPFEIGTIESFENLNPGEDYVNDTFVLVRDEQMLAFERFPQVLLIDNYSASFSVGDTVTQALTGTTGVITKVDNDIQGIYVLPFSYYGFKTGLGDFINHKGNNYDILAVERDYSAKRYGENAKLLSETLFSTGRIAEAEIRDSGFGYIDNDVVYLINDDGERQAKAILRANSQGITAGFWSSQSSHLNGYWNNPDSHTFEYYDSKMKVQDSDYYQEYSYEIQSTVSVPKYEKVLKDTMHLAGTKMFGNFVYNKLTGPTMTHKFQLRVKDDYVIGGSPIVGPNQDIGDQTVRADTVIYSVDSINITSDNGTI